MKTLILFICLAAIFLFGLNSFKSDSAGIAPKEISAKSDRDGKLDFMLNLNPLYDSTDHKLFLLSAAKKDEIVRGVAQICQLGC